MRIRREPAPTAEPSGPRLRSELEGVEVEREQRERADSLVWMAWRKRNGEQAMPHAFRVVGGVRAAKSICHNYPGAGAAVVEVAPTQDRCASCDDVLRRNFPRGGAAKRLLVGRPDPRTLYNPTHRFEDWDR